MLQKAALFISLCAALSAAPKSVLIFDEAPFKSCHASTILETRRDSSLAAWFRGPRGGQAERSNPGGARRERPLERAIRDGSRAGDRVLQSGTLLLERPDLMALLQIWSSPEPVDRRPTFSHDDGKTWWKPQHQLARFYGPIRNKPVLLTHGTIVVGTSVESYEAWTSWVERSTDNAKTWSKHGPIIYPRRSLCLHSAGDRAAPG